MRRREEIIIAPYQQCYGERTFSKAINRLVRTKISQRFRSNILPHTHTNVCIRSLVTSQPMYVTYRVHFTNGCVLRCLCSAPTMTMITFHAPAAGLQPSLRHDPGPVGDVVLPRPSPALVAVGRAAVAAASLAAGPVAATPAAAPALKSDANIRRRSAEKPKEEEVVSHGPIISDGHSSTNDRQQYDENSRQRR